MSSKYESLIAIKPSIDTIFDYFYKTMLADPRFSMFFRNEEMVKQLLEKQKKS